MAEDPTENAPNVLAQLRRLISSDAVREDGQLPTERALAEALGVGSRALRSALEVLEEEGLIWRRQGKGTFIGQPPDPTGVLAADFAGNVDAAAIMEARLQLEPSLAWLAAHRATADDVARMYRLIDHIGLSPEADTAELWDGALHRLIARVAGNPLLLTAFQLLDEVRIREDWQMMRASVRSPQSLAESDKEHRAIVEAIASGQAKAARKAMKDHLSRLAQNMTTRLAEAAE